ncbi:PAS domain S-box protein [Floridanema aerugineum]|jgi:PAS domain S-box-containing protein|uniref:PAS domain S-box protein n=1 Tax=Floridaenema aerugineum BLCC-F46 TaxID=3153654 RepID=A0ABV4X5U7_9CYAN
MLDETTENTQTENFLKQALEQLTFHLENSPVGVVEWDNQSRVKRWSKQAEKMFGWQAEEVLGKCWDEWQFVFETDVDRVYKNAVSTRTAEEPMNIHYNRNYTKDGRVLDCEWYNSALLDEFGNVVSVLSLVLDVSDRKQAETELKKSEEQLKELGCEQGQGFYFSKALDPQAATALIISQQKQPKWGETVTIPESKKKLNPQVDRFKKVI